MTKVLPIVMMFLQLAAAFVYWADGDWKRALYWVAATVLTFSVTV